MLHVISWIKDKVKSMKRTLQDIGGLIPAMMTCFDEKGNYDASRQKKLTNFLLKKGVDGLYLTGSTGETFLMNPEERKKVVETVVDEVGGNIPLIVHVGDIGTGLSIDLAKHAEKAGADAISSVPPFYWKFSGDEIYGYYKDISESCSLPMVVYNIALAGLVDFSMIRRLASIENVKGIKYTATTHYEIMRIKEEIGHDFVVYSGCDEMAMSGLCFGADGIIGSFYNVIPEIFRHILDAQKAGKMEEMEYWQKCGDAVILFVLQYPFFSSMKQMLRYADIDVGYCRKPFARLTEAQEKELRSGLKKIKEKYHITGVATLENL
jgi:N-acetylneuraminate lyase